MKRRRLLWAIAPIIVLGLAVLSFTATAVATKVSVGQSPDQVWSVLTDFDSYRNWNTFIPEASGTAAAGQKIRVVFNSASGRKLQINPAILVADRPRELRWLGHLFVPRLFDGEHYFILKPRADGGTDILHGEEFRGVLVATGDAGQFEADLKRMNADLARELARRYPASDAR